jgi:hypothetical protein
MADLTKIEAINREIDAYFSANPTLTIAPVKDLMPAFISAGIFTKDIKKGMPIRKILRELDKSEQLDLIPSVHAEKEEQAIYWYFIPSTATAPSAPYKQAEKTATSDESKKRTKSDEAYVIDLCDKFLGIKAYRQQKFDFLVGDLHKDGKTKTQLPVDAYYAELKTVVEFQRNEDPDFDNENKKQNKKTVSGMTRGEQRKRYDERKAKVLPMNGIKFIILHASDFKCDVYNKLMRNLESDMKVIKAALTVSGY